MKKTKIFSRMLAILIMAVIVGFTSCSKDDNKEPEPKIPNYLMSKWYKYTPGPGQIDRDIRYFIEFNADNTYSYVTENETINGIYKIMKSEKGTYDITWYNAQLGEEVTFTSEATLYKMLASGGSVYDKLWMYYTGSAGWGERLNVYLYSGNEFVKILDTYRRNDNSP